MRLPLQVGDNHLNLRGEIPKQLTAGPAGRSQFFRVRDDLNLAEIPLAFAKRLEQGRAFRAEGQSIAGAFYVASGINGAVGTKQRGSHAEMGIKGEGIFSRLPRCLE